MAARVVLWVLILLALVLPAGPAFPAPAPLPRRAKVPAIPAECVMVWGTHRCRAAFSASGNYDCDWFGVRYVGSWRRDGGTLWITESSAPLDPHSWRTYEIQMEPCLRRGRIISGSPGVSFRLE